MSNNFQGVDLTTGKLSLSVPLINVSGPNGFGESLSLVYSTLGLMNDVRTWNQDSPTSVVGLGWSLMVPFIARMGNGSIRDTFLLNGTPLLLKTFSGDSNSGYILTFETSTFTLTQITYDSATETWTLKDPDGVTYIYGGTNNDNAIDWGVNWQSQGTTNSSRANQTPARWVDSSINITGQCQYALRWHLVSKTNLYGQQVNYRYSKLEQNVGSLGNGAFYTTASYLIAIEVAQGGSLLLSYQPKYPSEFPAPRVQYDQNKGTSTNPYQDLIIQHYLANLSLINSQGTLISIITLTYGFLWDNFADMGSLSAFTQMNKRLLTSIMTTNADGMPLVPATIFDYWGYSDPNNDGFYNYYKTFSSSKMLQMVNTDLSPSSFPTNRPNNPYVTVDNVNYYPLFGHLKTVTNPTGAINWYSYREVSDNYDAVWPESEGNFSSHWQNQLDLQNIAKNYVINSKGDTTWECFRIFWGVDNFAVLTFYSKSSSQYENHKAMGMMIFEWVGQWIPVTQVFNTDTKANETDDDGVVEFEIQDWKNNQAEDYNLVQAGNGMFALVRTGIPVSDGAITLFNRNPYRPGYWLASYFEPNITLNTYIINLSSPTLAISLSMAGAIVTVVDTVANKAYLYGWNGNSWDSMLFTPPPYSSKIKMDYGSPLTVGVKGNDVILFYLNSDGSTLAYQFYRYDTTYSLSWHQDEVSESTGTLPFTLYNYAVPPPFYHDVEYGTTSVIANNGYCWVCPSEYLVNGALSRMPFLISWDDNYTVYVQQIYEQKDQWAVEDSTVVFSSIASNIYTANTGDLKRDNDTKIAFRFTANSSPDDYTNFGWQSNDFPNARSATTLANMPLPDLTIVASESDGKINYCMYQYNPFTQKWDATDLNTILGSDIDWGFVVDVISIIILVLSILTMGMSAGASALADGALDSAFVLDAACKLIDVALTPISTVLTTISRLLGGMWSFAEATTEAVTQIVGNLAGLADNAVQSIWQHHLLNRLLTNLNQGYSTPGFSYILAGAQFNGTQPFPIGLAQLFYGQWTTGNPNNDPPTFGSYTWQPITTFNNISNPVCGDSTKFYMFGLTQSTFSLGNNFIPFDCMLATESGVANDDHHYQANGQVAFMQNGGLTCLINMPMTPIPGQYIHEESTYKAYLYLTGEQTFSIPYHFSSYETSGGNYGIPLLYAPWGGILGFLGQFQSQTDKKYQCDFCYPVQIGLFMAKDQQVSGPVYDWVVDKITVQDGFQTLATHFQYMPQLAVFDRSIQTIVYNQTRVASGGQTYSDAAAKQGWQEFYFYNGGIYFFGSDYGHLNFDPLQASDSPFNQANAIGNPYPLLLKGLMYCQRTMKSQDGQEFVNGYEATRLLNFYQGFERPVYDDMGDPIGQQFSTGVLKKLTAIYQASSVTTQQYIDFGYPGNQYYSSPPPSTTLTTTYTFYDLEGFYGYWTPNDPSSNYYYLWVNNDVHLESALPLATMTFNYRYDPSAPNSTCIEAFYTQIVPGIMATVQNAPNTYQQFLANNLYNANVQRITWYHPNVPSISGQPFTTPETVWGNPNNIEWQIIHSTATIWQEFIDPFYSELSCWYPAANFGWQGNADGSPWTNQYQYFPWANPPVNNTPNTVWLPQGNIPIQVTYNGIVIASQNITGLPTFMLYDKLMTLPIARFTNAGNSASESFAFYLGFEPYEDLSSWALMINQSQPTNSWSFSSLSYSGNRSLLLSPGKVYTLSLPLTLPTPDERQWLFFITNFCQPSDAFKLTFYITSNNNPIQVFTRTFSTSSELPAHWINYRAECTFPVNLSDITNLDIEMDCSNSKNPIYIDSVYFFPIQNASFSIQTYDAATRFPIAQASSQSFMDYSFSTYSIYNNRQQLIGNIQRGDQLTNPSQPNIAAAIALMANYSSREGFTNNDEFNSADPNASLLIKGGANQSTAGYYFDFRDGVNPWSLGQVVDNGRLLLLQTNESAHYTLNSKGQWGIAVRAQLQGWIVFNSQSLNNDDSNSNSAVALPTPAKSNPFHVWGAYTDQSADFKAFDIDFSGSQSVLSIYNSSSVTQNNNPILKANGQLLVCDQNVNLFALFQGNDSDNSQYQLLRYLNNGNLSLQNSPNVLYPLITTDYGWLYYADQNTGLYRIDVTNVANQGDSCFTPIKVLSYALSPSGNAFCPVAPAVNTATTLIAFILTDSSEQANLVTYNLLNNSSTIFNFPDANLTFTTSPLIAEDGAIVVYANNTLYSFSSLYGLSSITLANVVGCPAISNGKIAVTLQEDNGYLILYDTPRLNFIAKSPLPLTATPISLKPPVIHGDKISLLAQTDATTWMICTFNSVGLLACAPYPLTASSSIEIQAFSPNRTSLCAMIDNTNFMRLDFSTPDASMTIGDGNNQITATFSNGNYTLTGDVLINTPDPVTVPSLQSYGDWLLMIIGNTVYFYADGQQIFAESLQLSEPLTNTITLSAGNSDPISWRDIIILTDPTLTVNYADGAGKVRQTQQLAEVVTPVPV